MFSAEIQVSLAAFRQDVLNFEKTVVHLIEQAMSVTQPPTEKSFEASEQTLSGDLNSSRSSDSKTDSNEANSRLSHNPIAIIGMSSIFPGAKDLPSYWNNILREVDCLSDVPASRWDAESYYDSDPLAADKTYCKRGGFIPDIGFDPLEFGLPPNILEATDVSQLLSLVLAREVIKDAGYDSKAFDRETTGVVLGTVSRQTSGPLWARLQYPIWEKVLESSGLPQSDREAIIKKIKLAYASWQENSFPGMLSNVVAGRIANRFDFGGLNCTLDAACASSLAALKMAISELVEHRADMMLAGGVDPDNSIFTYLCFSKTPALSRRQTSKPFDVDSDGIMLGEGAGMVVLKRLADAERAGDRIYAVIRGLGTSSDGRAKSIYAPRPTGQLKALRRAYRDADIDPSSVGLLEAHGTGTPAGDVAEFESLKGLFEGSRARAESIALGSVKSQIGHTKTAAGMAGLIKASLALHHKVLPPTINVSKPNPKLNIESSPFYLNTALRPWMQPPGEVPRRAGVSSFGFGGTNFHVVLEEYQSEQAAPYRVNPTPCTLLLAAETTARLLAQCEQMRDELSESISESISKNVIKERFADFVAASRTRELAASDARVGFVAKDVAEAVSKLKVVISLLKNSDREAWEHPQGLFFRQHGRDLAGKVVALFSGQGSQYLEMGRSLAVNFPEVRQAYAQMNSVVGTGSAGSEAMKGTTGDSVGEAVYPPPVFTEAARNEQVEKLRQTEFAQPAIGAFSVGLYRIFCKAGLEASFTAGHSFGEMTALWAAGVLSDDDYGRLVRSRAQAMATPDTADSGTMLAVKGDAQQLRALMPRLPGVEISNINSPQQLVLAGDKADIAAAERTLSAAGFSPMALPVAAAFHTQRVSYAQKSFGEAVQAAAFKPAKIPVYSNVVGQVYPQAAAGMREILQRQMVCPVEFQQEIENIYAAGGRCFVEFGPKRVLTNFVEEILGDRPYTAVALNASRRKDSDLQLREAAVRLRVEGLLLKDIDPYALPQPVVAKTNRKKMDVPINGASYISEKTRLAFNRALAEGSAVEIPSRSPVPSVEQVGHFEKPSKPVEVNGRVAIASNGHSRRDFSEEKMGQGGQPAPFENNSNGKQALNGKTAEYKAEYKLEKQLSGGPTSDDRKPESIRLDGADSRHSSSKNSFEQPIEPQPPKEQTARKQTAREQTTEQILHSLERTLSQFSQHQNHISTVHKCYLENHQDYTQAAQALTQQRQSLILDRLEKGVDSTVLASSERSLTTFHTHQQETSRTHSQYLKGQISSAEQFFELGQQTYQTLIEGGLVKETEEVLKLVEVDRKPTELNSKPAEVDLKPSPPEETVVEEPVAEEVAEETATNLSSATEIGSELELALLEIASDKTGYPVEMLELDMDMEADLGIDSLKRVEIVGAFQDRFPNLPQPGMEELAEQELRTLAQVAGYMRSLVAPSELVGAIASESNRKTEEEDIKKEVNGEKVDEDTEISDEPDYSVSLQEIQTQLLAIVSDKTGYPVEMLELDMDMEADLGIDSLKRVEIVGAFQDRFPNLPQPGMEELAEQELRTLAQVCDYMQSLGASAKKKLKPPLASRSLSIPFNRQSDSRSSEISPLPRSPVCLKFLPPPDWLTLVPADGQVCLVTDDGSELTVELVGRLLAMNWKVVLLRFLKVPSAKTFPTEVEQVVVEESSEGYLGEMLEAIAQNIGKPATFIHLHPHPAMLTSSESMFSETDSALVKQVFFMAKHLKRYFVPSEGETDSRRAFLTVARLNGAFGLSTGLDADSVEAFSPIVGGLFGLVKTLRAEWPTVFCRALDLHPTAELASAADCIVSELHDPEQGLVEVSYAQGRRSTLVAVSGSL